MPASTIKKKKESGETGGIRTKERYALLYKNQMKKDLTFLEFSN